MNVSTSNERGNRAPRQVDGEDRSSATPLATLPTISA